jgi:adenylate cyclase
LGREIERKFLVADDGWRGAAVRSMRMEQGYLASSETASVRIRVAGDQGRLNIKGGGFVADRAEYEYAVPLDDARELLETLCRKPTVTKTRHWVPCGAWEWEVDEFHGANAGLVVAEIELEAEDAEFERPSWVAAEVTHLTRYYNVCLVDHPYSEWDDAERAGP